MRFVVCVVLVASMGCLATPEDVAEEEAAQQRRRPDRHDWRGNICYIDTGSGDPLLIGHETSWPGVCCADNGAGCFADCGDHTHDCKLD